VPAALTHDKLASDKTN